MKRPARLLVLCAALSACHGSTEPRVAIPPEPTVGADGIATSEHPFVGPLEASAFGLRFQVSASAVPRPQGWAVRVRVEIQNPGDAAQKLPIRPIVLSGAFTQLRADGSIDDDSGFAEAPMPRLDSLVVPARRTVTVQRVYPEDWEGWGFGPGEALSLTVAVGRPFGHPATQRQQDLAEVRMLVPKGSASPQVEVLRPADTEP